MANKYSNEFQSRMEDVEGRGSDGMRISHKKLKPGASWGRLSESAEVVTQNEKVMAVTNSLITLLPCTYILGLYIDDF